MTQTLTKRERVIYWLSTGAVCAVMVFSAINFNLKVPLGPMKGAFKHLGYPDYFRIELTIAKALGVLALLIPIVPIKVKEFAYAGFAITLASASIAHFSVGDPALFVIDPLFFLTVLVVSYAGFQKMNRSVTELQPAERRSNHGGERLAAAQVRQSA